MDQRPTTQLASKAMEHQQSRQNTEANSVQEQEQAWYSDKLWGGIYQGDQEPKKTEQEDWSPRHSEPHTKRWIMNNEPVHDP